MTRIACSIPLDAPRRHVGHLAVPFSDDAHAYGVIPVPIAVLGGGDGPTVLLAAGVHGDEYEGQIVLRRLLHTLDPTRLAGRLIVLPALNLPAVRAARRTSPIDGANMNRAFPGDPDSGPTTQLAHYVETLLLPRCQAALDLHFGGTASEYLPCSYVYAGGPIAAAKAAMADAFAAPISIVVGATAETRSLSAACERQGVPMIATELGGGFVSHASMAVADAGTSAALRHLGLLPAPMDAFEILGAMIPEVLALKLLADLDYSLIPNAQALEPAQRQAKLVAIWTTQEMIICNAAKLAEQEIPLPTSLAKLADPRLRGRVMIPDITSGGGLEAVGAFALTAGGSETNIDPGLQLIHRIPDLRLWKADGEAVTAFKSGDIWVAEAHAGWAVRTEYAGVKVVSVPVKIGAHIGLIKEGWMGIGRASR